MSTYAKTTDVTVEKSQMDVERVIKRYGADAFRRGWGNAHSSIEFMIDGVHYRIEVPDPDPSSKDFTVRRDGSRMDKIQREGSLEQAKRQRWRAMLLLVTAQLEAVSLGLMTAEQAFLPNVVTPDGGTVGTTLLPQIREAVRLDLMPRLLEGPR